VDLGVERTVGVVVVRRCTSGVREVRLGVEREERLSRRVTRTVGVRELLSVRLEGADREREVVEGRLGARSERVLRRGVERRVGDCRTGVDRRTGVLRVGEDRRVGAARRVGAERRGVERTEDRGVERTPPDRTPPDDRTEPPARLPPRR